MQELLANQELLWVITVVYDLGLAIILFKFFGKYGLYTAVILGIILGNLQGGKISELEIFGFSFTASMGAILYSGIYFATDVLNEKYTVHDIEPRPKQGWKWTLRREIYKEGYLFFNYINKENIMINIEKMLSFLSYFSKNNFFTLGRSK